MHYWASPLEARLCGGQPVAVIGGGNSAGQAAVFLAAQARHVTLIARRPLAQTMSRYLVERIAAQPNIGLLEGAEVIAVAGEDRALREIRWQRRGEVEDHALALGHMFLFIGAEPNTAWLAGTGIKLDPRGFIVTGREAGADRLPLESSRRGVFAVGDVRSGSVKRVAAAAGDGAQVVAAIHGFLAASEIVDV